jgi:hypothetical protein
MPKKPAKGSTKAGPDGVPVDLVGYADGDPLRWLSGLTLRLDMLESLRPNQHAKLIARAREAAAMTQRAIDARDSSSAATTAILAAHYAWMLTVLFGAQERLQKHAKATADRRKGALAAKRTVLSEREEKYRSLRNRAALRISSGSSTTRTVARDMFEAGQSQGLEIRQLRNVLKSKTADC